VTELGVIRALAPLRRWHPWLVPAMVALGFLAALSEGIGLSLFLPFLHSAGAGTFAPAEDGTLGAALERLVGGLPPSERLLAVSLGILVLVLLKNLLVYASETLRSWTRTLLVHSLRERLAGRLLHARLDFVESMDSGKLLNALQQQTQETGTAFGNYGELLVRACTSLVFAVFLLLVSWKLTLAVGGALLAISLLVRLAWRRVEAGSARFVAAFDALSQRSLELLSGMRTIRVFDREEDERRRFAAASQRASRVWFQLDLLSGMVRPVSEVLVVAVLVALLFGALQDVAALPTALTFAFILYRLRPQVQGLDVARAQLLAGRAPVETVMGLVGAADEAPPPARGGDPFEGLRDEIRFENVSFRHAGAARETLRGVSLRIPARRTTALIGPSGAGKSSLIHLLLRLYPPTRGEIRVDGRPLAGLELGAWRRRVCAVTQDAVLFHASVAENIAYGRPGATLDQVIRAARMAGADGFVRALPQGYETLVGDRGVRLSGGQKQRIALARALVRDPELLILDEATNALDAEAESLVRDAVAAIGRELTLLVVSHRLSAVAGADHFVLLEDGRVMAEGARSEIPSLREAVHRLYGARLADAFEGGVLPCLSAGARE
jgi:subfamily B ATP-binding cassette protein MsbA